MKRRDFLKAMTLAGATAIIDLSGVGKVLANSAPAPKGGLDMVAIMGGTPVAMLDRMLAEYGGIGAFVKKGQKVVIKPNIGWDKAPQLAANTNPDLIGALVNRCLKAGAAEVVVFDHTCNEWTKCYASSGVKAAVEKNGGKMVSAADESYYVDVKLPMGKKLKEAKIHKALVDCDVWFNVPIMKHHGGAKMSLSMKNYMGIVWDRKMFHKTDLQQCIADVASWEKKPALHIIDGYRAMIQNGPQGKTTDDVVVLRSLLASKDPVAVDTAAVKMFSQARAMTIEDASHILRAEELRLGTTNIDKLNVKRIKM